MSSLQQDVLRSSSEVASELALFEQVSQRLRDAVPYDGSTWFATDPATLLGTNAVRVENVGWGYCDTYWECECLVDDVLLFRDVARSSTGVATLYDATGQRPAGSARYREYLRPQGYGDELRAAFRLGDSTWGVLDLYRDASRTPFTPYERDQVAQIAPLVAQRLRYFAVAERKAAVFGEPGTALFDDRGALLSLNEQAERLFEEVGGPGWRHFPASMTPVRAVTALALGRGATPATTQLRAASGRWITLGASRLRRPDGSPAPTAVTIGPARPERIAPVIIRAYALTQREQQVTHGVARGLTNQEIAAQLFLSPHTVRDYLKTVYLKVGVTSRGELMAKLFSEHYMEQLHDGATFVEW